MTNPYAPPRAVVQDIAVSTAGIVPAERGARLGASILDTFIFGVLVYLKKLIGIKVVRSDGSAVSLGRLIWMRNVLNWLINIVPLYGVLDSPFIFAESRQCLHDRIADTIVIKS
ncbi:MAG TPA: RDD family protein [Vicinamibacterales bacterium]|nr:RDD family protein [Vicinamibacterales bacterium]